MRITYECLCLLRTASDSPANDISACGIKDKRALTYQQISITLRRPAAAAPGYWREAVAGACGKLLELGQWNWRRNDKPDAAGLAAGNFSLLADPLFVGANWGNHFRIRIRGCAPEVAAADVAAGLQLRLDRIAEAGFPNYFGSQRMGALRDYSSSSSSSNGGCGCGSEATPLGPRVGKLLLQGRLREAVEAIIIGDAAAGDDDEDDDGAIGAAAADEAAAAATRIAAARSLFQSGAPPQEVLKAFPPSAQRERALLRGMARHGWSAQGDEGRRQAERVLEMLPYHTRLLWVHSYQVSACLTLLSSAAPSLTLDTCALAVVLVEWSRRAAPAVAGERPGRGRPCGGRGCGRGRRAGAH